MSARQITVECRTPGCPELGAQKKVTLQSVALHVVEIPQLRCTRCAADMWISSPLQPEVGP